MNIETLKLPVRELSKGMQVVKLDRPWLETPFKLQGFRIKTDEELTLLQQYCSFVYVDIQRGIAPPRGRGERVTLTEDGDVVSTEGRLSAPQRPRSEANERTAENTALPQRAVEYALTTGFAEELPAARAALHDTKLALKGFIHELKLAPRADLSTVKRGATALEESALRNPDPLMLLRALHSDEVFSYRHSVHSAILGITVGRALGFKRQTIHELTMGLLLADIGKLRLPKELLRTSRRLDRRETEIIKLHVKFGVEMATELDGLTPGTVEVIASHHERFDGSGYPDGLLGGEIPLLARIAGLVDSFDAITSLRAYSEPIPAHEAMKEMYASTIDVFQRELVEHLIQALGAFPVGSLVELSDGSLAVVVALNRQRRLLPQVIRLTDAHKQPTTDRKVVDLGQPEGPSVTVKTVLEPGSHGIALPMADIVAN